jgi:hypothetical protein
MFEPLKKSSDSQARIRRISLMLVVTSLILFIASYAWYEIQTLRHEDSLFAYWPSEIEIGLTWGAMLGAVLGAGLFVYSLILGRGSRK